MTDPLSGTRWKRPTIREIADLAGVGTASVDRVLNNRPGVKANTRNAVQAAIAKLTHDGGMGDGTLDIRLFCESGVSFNGTMETAAQRANRTVPGVHITGHYEVTHESDPARFARRIEDEGAEADGVIVVAREHPATNRAVRKLVAAGLPVLCLTTDLPSSRRSGYVGNDQTAAGCVAAQLIGQILPKEIRSILLVMSVPFRSQLEREMGFRRVLRTEFPHLRIEERILADDSPETTFRQVMSHIETHGAPAAVYNTAGANRGVAQAIEAIGLTDQVIFVGHELTPISRGLLENGMMDYVISHDFTMEVAAAAKFIRDFAAGEMAASVTTPILIHTRYNCGL